MLQCILSASRIQRVAVRQEWHSALLFTKICHCFCIVRTKKCQVAKLTKMHLYRNEFPIHIDILNPCRNTKFFQFIQLARTHRTTEIGKVNH